MEIIPPPNSDRQYFLMKHPIEVGFDRILMGLKVEYMFTTSDVPTDMYAND
jgi:hypothetical protein